MAVTAGKSDKSVVVHAEERFRSVRVWRAYKPEPDRSGNIIRFKPQVRTSEEGLLILLFDKPRGEGRRCLIRYTVLPAPEDPQDTLRYLRPYIRRGWLPRIHEPGRPHMPVALRGDPSRPEEVLRSALLLVDQESLAALDDDLPIFVFTPFPS